MTSVDQNNVNVLTAAGGRGAPTSAVDNEKGHTKRIGKKMKKAPTNALNGENAARETACKRRGWWDLTCAPTLKSQNALSPLPPKAVLTSIAKLRQTNEMAYLPVEVRASPSEGVASLEGVRGRSNFMCVVSR